MAARKTRATRKTVLPEEDMSSEPAYSLDTPKPKSSKRFIKIALAVVLLALIAALVARNYKSAFVVGTVNGTPILRTELNQRLANRFGTQMLEALIGEKLITQAAAKENIRVSNEEIQARIAEIEQSLTGGSMSLEDALKMQGMTRGEFENQVKVQLMIDKMFSDEVSVSAQEIDEFVKTNAAALTASGEAEKRAQAEKELKTQLVSQKFAEWFNQVKTEAKIDRYL